MRLVKEYLPRVYRNGSDIEARAFMLAAASMGGAKDSSTAVPLVYSESFARDRKTAQAFMDAYLKGVRVYNDAFQKSIDKDRVIGVLASRAKMEPEIIRDSFPGGLDPDGKVNFRFLDECQGFFVQQKYLAESIDLKRLVDPSFAEDFVRRNGAYAG